MVAACGFNVAGTVSGGDTILDAPSEDVGDAASCAAPIIIDDRFENDDLATAGSFSIGSGFTPVTNASTGNGTSVELPAAGLRIRTSNNTPPQAPAHGVASNTSFAFSPAGMTVRLEVTAADTPIWNGIVLALQSNKADTDGAGGSLVLRIRGDGTNAFKVDMGDQMSYAPSLGLQPYDKAELADGFVVTWILHATTWSYVVEGLLAGGGSVADAGSYVAGQTPADLLDASVHVGIHIQGNPDDVSPRVLRVNRVTLWDGTCP